MKITLSIAMHFCIAMACQAQETTGDNSPAILGDGNTIIYGVLDIEKAILNFNPVVLSSLANRQNIRSLSTALQAPGLARRLFQALELSGSEQLLSDFLKAGLDPNFVVVGPDGQKEALLTAAFFAQNANAMAVLLGAGAFSHGYQDLLHYQEELPFFLYPVHSVLSDDSFTRTEKDEIVKLMDQGGVFLALDEGSPFEASTMRALSILAEQRAGPDLQNCTDNKALVCPVEVYGCPDSEFIPQTMIRVNRGSYREYGELIWLSRIGLFDGKEYHIYLGKHTWRGYLVLAEFSADLYSASLLKYRPGSNLCSMDGVSYNLDCWMSFDVEIDSSKGDLYSGSVLTYTAKFCN